MANVMWLSKCSATKHPATVHVQSLLHCNQLPHRPASFNLNLRFIPHLDSSLKITARTTPLSLITKPLMSSFVHHFADRSRTWVNKAGAILNPLKTCGIALVIVAVLLMSCPVRPAWARASSQVAIMAAETDEEEEPEDEVEPMGPWMKAGMGASFIMYFAVLLMIGLLDANQIVREREKMRRTSVLKLQVGLSGAGRSLQRELQLIAEIPSTSTHTVESRVLAGATSALLCHPDYCTSASTSVHVVDVEDGNNEGEGKKKLYRLYKEEQAKFNEEQRPNPPSSRARDIVVTFFMLVCGDHKISTIKGRTGLKYFLQQLESIPPSNIKALQLLWTPQAENKLLSGEPLESCPLLKPL